MKTKTATKTYYLIRRGWNSANQSSMGGKRNPSNTFESCLDRLVGIVEAENEDAACEMFSGTVYNNQSLYAVSNPRAVKGLTREIREFGGCDE
jgi:hypothetical protein